MPYKMRPVGTILHHHHKRSTVRPEVRHWCAPVLGTLLGITAILVTEKKERNDARNAWPGGRRAAMKKMTWCASSMSMSF